MTLQVGDKAPSFALESQTGDVVTSDSLLGQKYILYFYPKDNTPGCTIQAKDYSSQKAAFEALGYRIFGVSRDSVKSHQNFCAKQDLTITLLSDKDETLCQAYGVMVEKKLYGKVCRGVLRSSFAIDETGHLSHVCYDVKAKDNVAMMLELLQ